MVTGKSCPGRRGSEDLGAAKAQASVAAWLVESSESTVSPSNEGGVQQESDFARNVSRAAPHSFWLLHNFRDARGCSTKGALTFGDFVVCKEKYGRNKRTGTVIKFSDNY